MDNPFNQVNEAFHERMKNPFMGSFILAFVAFNWKALFYILFSQKDVESKLTLVDCYTNCNSLIVYPLALALIYVIILPYIGAAFEWVTVRANILRENNAHQKRRRSLEYELDIARETRELNEIRTGNRQSEELQEEIENLKSALQSKDAEIVTYSERVDKVAQERQEAIEKMNEDLKKLESEKKSVEEKMIQMNLVDDELKSTNRQLSIDLSKKEKELQGIYREREDLQKRIKELESSNENIPDSLVQLVKMKMIEKNGIKALVEFRRFIQTQAQPTRKTRTIASNYLELFKEMLLVFDDGKRSMQPTPLGKKLHEELTKEGV